MELKRSGKLHLNNLALAFFIPFAGMLFVMLISGYEPFGNYSMLYSDMYHQYYPFFVEFRRALLRGEGLSYTWSVGLGMDYLGLIAYYLASPLNFLCILVPEDWLLEAFSMLVPIKLGLAGLSFAFFLKKIFGKNDISIAIFGGFYGLCAWALGFQWNVMWLDTFALFPMVVLGTVALLRDGKFVLYTLSLFLSIYANYYVGLFTCIFVFLLFFVYQICRWGGWKKFFTDFFRIGVFSVIAIGMTLILTLPALSALQSTQSSVNKFPTGFRLNIASTHDLKGLLDAMGQVVGNMGGAIKPNFKEGLPNLYCGILSIGLMFLYLLARKIPLRDKICAVMLLLFFNVSFIIRQLDYIWHGFHFTNMIPYRFSFLYSFVVLYMAYRAWTIRGQFSVAQIFASGLLTGGVLWLCKTADETTALNLGSLELDVPVYIIYNSVFLFLYVIAFLYGKVRVEVSQEATEQEIAAARAEQRKIRQVSGVILTVVMCVELIGNLISFGLHFPGTSVANYPKGTEHTASVIRYMHERERRNLFFRAETTHSQTLNDGALNGYNGVTAFTSSANVKTTLFMQSLGFSAKNTYNRYLYEEGSPVANLFLGLKYMIDRDGKQRQSTYFEEVNRFGNTSLLLNKAYLPLGFLTEKALADLTFDTSENAFVFQNKLFAAATGYAEDVWHRLEGHDLSIESNGANVTESNSTGYCRYTSDAGNGEVLYNYVTDRSGFACLHLNLPKRNDYYVSINGAELYKENISLPQMIAVGDVQAGDTITVRIVCKAGESSTMEVRAAVLDGEVFDRGYQRLAENTWQLTAFETDYLSGIVKCSRDGLLYTSIPQNGNWKVLVDGQETETLLVGECMAAVELTEGIHRVEFRYENAAFALGWKLTALFGLVFLMLVQMVYKPDWKKLISREKGKYQK